ncbi:hypothetical protein A3Q56_00947 [Intoshia linei]|uniref:PI3K/PI4K catalytic domain-containing protein n=1 Tax=Intoshia linei TaxID=1819745 RepID=A0A177BCM6_9BILA|nr:hypothetical protein A3Q56_00947 [Intoshia linei]
MSAKELTILEIELFLDKKCARSGPNLTRGELEKVLSVLDNFLLNTNIDLNEVNLMMSLHNANLCQKSCGNINILKQCLLICFEKLNENVAYDFLCLIFEKFRELYIQGNDFDKYSSEINLYGWILDIGINYIGENVTFFHAIFDHLSIFLNSKSQPYLHLINQVVSKINHVNIKFCSDYLENIVNVLITWLGELTNDHDHETANEICEFIINFGDTWKYHVDYGFGIIESMIDQIDCCLNYNYSLKFMKYTFSVVRVIGICLRNALFSMLNSCDVEQFSVEVFDKFDINVIISECFGLITLINSFIRGTMIDTELIYICFRAISVVSELGHHVCLQIDGYGVNNDLNLLKYQNLFKPLNSKDSKSLNEIVIYEAISHSITFTSNETYLNDVKLLFFKFANVSKIIFLSLFKSNDKISDTKLSFLLIKMVENFSYYWIVNDFDDILKYFCLNCNEAFQSDNLPDAYNYLKFLFLFVKIAINSKNNSKIDFSQSIECVYKISNTVTKFSQFSENLDQTISDLKNVKEKSIAHLIYFKNKIPSNIFPLVFNVQYTLGLNNMKYIFKFYNYYSKKIAQGLIIYISVTNENLLLILISFYEKMLKVLLEQDEVLSLDFFQTYFTIIYQIELQSLFVDQLFKLLNSLLKFVQICKRIKCNVINFLENTEKMIINSYKNVQNDDVYIRVLKNFVLCSIHFNYNTNICAFLLQHFTFDSKLNKTSVFKVIQKFSAQKIYTSIESIVKSVYIRSEQFLLYIDLNNISSVDFKPMIKFISGIENGYEKDLTNCNNFAKNFYFSLIQSKTTCDNLENILFLENNYFNKIDTFAINVFVFALIEKKFNLHNQNVGLIFFNLTNFMLKFNVSISPCLHVLDFVKTDLSSLKIEKKNYISKFLSFLFSLLVNIERILFGNVFIYKCVDYFSKNSKQFIHKKNEYFLNWYEKSDLKITKMSIYTNCYKMTLYYSFRYFITVKSQLVDEKILLQYFKMAAISLYALRNFNGMKSLVRFLNKHSNLNININVFKNTFCNNFDGLMSLISMEKDFVLNVVFSCLLVDYDFDVEDIEQKKYFVILENLIHLINFTAIQSRIQLNCWENENEICENDKYFTQKFQNSTTFRNRLFKFDKVENKIDNVENISKMICFGHFNLNHFADKPKTENFAMLDIFSNNVNSQLAICLTDFVFQFENLNCMDYTQIMDSAISEISQNCLPLDNCLLLVKLLRLKGDYDNYQSLMEILIDTFCKKFDNCTTQYSSFLNEVSISKVYFPSSDNFNLEKFKKMEINEKFPLNLNFELNNVMYKTIQYFDTDFESEISNSFSQSNSKSLQNVEKVRCNDRALDSQDSLKYLESASNECRSRLMSNEYSHSDDDSWKMSQSQKFQNYYNSLYSQDLNLKCPDEYDSYQDGSKSSKISHKNVKTLMVNEKINITSKDSKISQSYISDTTLPVKCFNENFNLLYNAINQTVFKNNADDCLDYFEISQAEETTKICNDKFSNDSAFLYFINNQDLDSDCLYKFGYWCFETLRNVDGKFQNYINLQYHERDNLNFDLKKLMKCICSVSVKENEIVQNEEILIFNDHVSQIDSVHKNLFNLACGAIIYFFKFITRTKCENYKTICTVFNILHVLQSYPYTQVLNVFVDNYNNVPVYFWKHAVNHLIALIKSNNQLNEHFCNIIQKLVDYDKSLAMFECIASVENHQGNDQQAMIANKSMVQSELWGEKDDDENDEIDEISNNDKDESCQNSGDQEETYNSQSFDMDSHWQTICVYSGNTHLNNLLIHFHKVYPKYTSQLSNLIENLKKIAFLPDEYTFAALQNVYVLLLPRLNKLSLIVANLQSANIKLDKKEINKLDAIIVDDISFENTENVIAYLMRPVITSLDTILEYISNSKSNGIFQKSFYDDFYSPINEFNETLNKMSQNPLQYPKYIINILKDLIVKLKKRIELRTKTKLSLESINKHLSNVKNLDIILPGCNNGKVSIVKMLDTVKTLPTKTRPKKISFLGSDGKTFHYLIKGFDDLRLDCRIQHVFNFINQKISHLNLDKFSHVEMKNDNFHYTPQIRTYPIYPLGVNCGLIGWIDNVVSIYSIYKNWLQKDFRKDTIYSRVNYTQTKENYNKLFNCLVQRTPSNVLSKSISLQYLDSSKWWKVYQRFLGSMAINSVFTYVYGIGDRHLDNILLDFKTGDVIHIDFSICFERGKILRIPETVPIRLTQNFMNALGSYKMEGTFKTSMAKILNVTKTMKYDVESFNNIFITDPALHFRSRKTDDFDSNKNGKSSKKNLSCITEEFIKLIITDSKRICQLLNVKLLKDGNATKRYLDEAKYNLINSLPLISNFSKSSKYYKFLNSKDFDQFQLINEERHFNVLITRIANVNATNIDQECPILINVINDMLQRWNDFIEYFISEVNHYKIIENVNSTGAVLRKINEKLDGYDFGRNFENSKSQIDLIVNKSTSLSKLSSMYRGWTAWF